jgi:capsular polysaccharide biosynthesis protein
VIHAPEPVSAFRRRSFLRRQPFLRRRAWVVALTGLLAFGIATLQSDSASSDYTAEATLVVQSGASDEGPGQAFEATKQAVNLVTVIENDQIIRQHVAATIKVVESTVEDNLGIATRGDTSSLLLTYTAPTPEMALQAVDAAIEVITAQNGYSTPPIAPDSVVLVEQSRTTTESGGSPFSPIFSLIVGLFLGLILAVIWERNDARIDSAEQLIGLVPAPVSDASVTGPTPALLRRWVTGFTGSLAKVGLLATPPGHMSSTAWVADWVASAYPEIFPAVGSPFSSRVVQVEPHDAKPKTARSRSAAREPLDVELIAAGTVTGGENGEAAALESTFVVLVVPVGSRTSHVTRSVRTLRQLGIEVGWVLLTAPSRLRRRLIPPITMMRTRTRLLHEMADEPSSIRVPE